ncbi:hypothetical protein QAD02_013986 [Eretmocerus hayati]|uniref:Uncharacterized protein n=1 Tax=Eretmocerus hayati TaxID=131215 RepID=A0ACC2P6J7_9HYME|nr:hypothetical protein QAD02_013986 [Eretmocerus hayati]
MVTERGNKNTGRKIKRIKEEGKKAMVKGELLTAEYTNGDWKYIKTSGIVYLAETWLGKGGRQWMEEKPSEFKCETREAKKEYSKGRASGGLLCAIRKEYETKEGKDGSNKEEKDKNWRKIAETAEKMKGERIIICGDMNARTGNKEGDASQEEGRKSKDKEINKEGLRLLGEIGKQGLMILNGEVEGDRQGEYTYIGTRGNTIIHYVIMG